jgi:NitT/TauT family transport system ATP-binding protein
MSLAKIAVRGLSKSFVKREPGGMERRVEVLRDISLDVPDQEFLCIVGPSGCGKTTFLRILDGLIPFDRGDILLDGRPVKEPGQDRGMVFQSFGLLPWRSVYGNVAIGLEIAGVPAEKQRPIVDRWIETIGLKGFENHYPHELSGGMQQRVGIARVLAIDPSVILMDEPFGALDAQTREFMQEELLRIWSQTKKTVVFITHSIDEAVYLADRVVVLSARPGRIDEILAVDLPRPRWGYDVRGTPRFAELRSRIWKMLKQDHASMAASPRD